MKVDLLALDTIKQVVGEAWTTGLSGTMLQPFLQDADLATAVNSAVSHFNRLSSADRALLKNPEKDNLELLQADFLNFYPTDSVSSYIPIAAKGPWVISAYGAVIYDTGGYGMLGFGHNPDFVRGALADDYVMANIMTASLQQKRFTEQLKKEIGHARKNGCPFYKFICMNSGSEAMSVATRISDLHAKGITDPGAVKAGATIKILAAKGAFHGRTGRPARASNSSLKKYMQLASYRNYTGTLLVEPNNIQDLERVFDEANERNEYIEFMVLEPVMGEGNPGLAITPEFYKRARELTRENHTLLIVDSIQAGLRAQGALSIVDYPGFEDLDAPDMESYSKAVNAGQYPVSVLAISKALADGYKPGIYGNTMTANPRALDLTTAVLLQVTPELRANIRERGLEFVRMLRAVQNECPELITEVQGTGLIVSCALGSGLTAVGHGSVEEKMRLNGVNVIHGGVNSLRFTPHFRVTTHEITLIIEVLKANLKD